MVPQSNAEFYFFSKFTNKKMTFRHMKVWQSYYSEFQALVGSTAALVVSLACSIYNSNTLFEIQHESRQFRHET